MSTRAALGLLIAATCILPAALAVGQFNGLSLVGVILASTAITCAVRASTAGNTPSNQGKDDHS